MNLIDAILLGFIQGATEFLPVSSSGHLAVVQHLLPDFQQPGLLFDVMLHLGTLLAIMIYFSRDIAGLCSALFRQDAGARHDRHLLKMIIIASVPTAIIGLLLKSHVEQWVESMLVVGSMLLITGTLLFVSERYRRGGQRGIEELSVTDALITGIAQGLAVLPGLSRSGSTIATLLFRGINGETAARFSFLMSIPAVVGAALLSLRDLHALSTGDIPAYLAGTAVAFFTGLLAIRVLLNMIRRQRLFWFTIYCWLAGSLVLTLLG